VVLSISFIVFGIISRAKISFSFFFARATDTSIELFFCKLTRALSFDLYIVTWFFFAFYNSISLRLPNIKNSYVFSFVIIYYTRVGDIRVVSILLLIFSY
jgi:hypothetical protein